MNKPKHQRNTRRYHLAATYGLTSSLLVTGLSASGQTDSPALEVMVPSALPFVGTRYIAFVTDGGSRVSASLERRRLASDEIGVDSYAEARERAGVFALPD